MFIFFVDSFPLNYFSSIRSGCITKFCIVVFSFSFTGTHQFEFLPKLNTGYKYETDFTTGLELHIKKTTRFSK